MNKLAIYNSDKFEYELFDISAEEVVKSLDLRSLLVKALDLEIIYDQIIEAYWDYKNKVNYWNLRSVSSPYADYLLNHEIRSSLNRLAFNLFNLSKLYLDWHYYENNKKKERCFSFELTGNPDVKQRVIEHRDDVYKKNKHYVVGCRLRAYSQHSALPVRGFTTGVRHNPENLSQTAHFSIFYDFSDLKKAGVPQKLLSKDMKLELTDIIDGYVYAISQKHMLNRELTNEVIENSRNSIVTMWDDYADKVGYKNYSCELQLESGERKGLSLEWFGVFDHLKEKHRNSINYSNIMFEK